mmetsp:Transcript_32878/g.55828  ORF Transcript_32878/g.55828 Transcript_32878/m.55828 type:complete len:91 (-) Transcript_32878:278-550(-)
MKKNMIVTMNMMSNWIFPLKFLHLVFEENSLDPLLLQQSDDNSADDHDDDDDDDDEDAVDDHDDDGISLRMAAVAPRLLVSNLHIVPFAR